MSGGRVERKLAAILAADVVGYSRLIGAMVTGHKKRDDVVAPNEPPPALAPGF